MVSPSLEMARLNATSIIVDSPDLSGPVMILCWRNIVPGAESRLSRRLQDNPDPPIPSSLLHLAQSRLLLLDVLDLQNEDHSISFEIYVSRRISTATAIKTLPDNNV
jgi:hypothetical protein